MAGPDPVENPRPIVLRTGAVMDAAGCFARPGAVAVRGGTVFAAGEVDAVMREAGGGADVRELPDRLVMPGLVNAHAHLSLTAIGTQPYGGSFADWLVSISAHIERLASTPGGIVDSARRGATLCRRAGVGLVGDITHRAERLAVYHALAESGLAGTCFVEMLSPGGPSLAAERDRLTQLERIDTSIGALRLGVQPHAPYSTIHRLYNACTDLALRRDLPPATHLAESLDEQQFVAEAQGVFRDVITNIGEWNPTSEVDYGNGLSPIEWMKPYLGRAPWLVAHCNYVSDDDLAILAETKTSVAYCPIASEYFGHPHGDHPPHRYREMLEAGINVCLGTDSILCQPPDEPQPLGMLAPMRRLYQRDSIDPSLLLAMATTHGAKAIGFDPPTRDVVTRCTGAVLRRRFRSRRRTRPTGTGIAFGCARRGDRPD